MNKIADKLTEAQQYAISIRPKSGGFPVFAEVLRQAGVKINRWFLPSCQSIYLTEDGAVVQQGIPIIKGIHEIPKFDREALISAIRSDQEGLCTFPEFLCASWKAGVIEYEVDFITRKVTYYGANGESYLEEYPAVEIKR
ncbi:MAG: DUF1398 family protein [Candidatus Megaira endosymbiont of Carteria cerasiformis]|jgi:uncharacterized protein YbcV (DUF1398 family)|nr:DUF1398 family protein [Candidatus Megaera polyxenophila]MCC8460665.1 DUF1398 family protein [Candidatus Megaera polyxenophila]